MFALGVVIASYLAAILGIISVIHIFFRPVGQALYDTLKDFQNLIGGALGIGSIAITALLGSALVRAQHGSEEREQRAALSKAFAVEMRMYNLLLADIAEAVSAEPPVSQMSEMELGAWHGRTNIPENALYQNSAAQLGSLAPDFAGGVTSCALARESLRLIFAAPPENDASKLDVIRQINVAIGICRKAIVIYDTYEKKNML